MELYRDKSFLASVAVGLVLWLASLASVYYSTSYANLNASNAVADLILSNTPVYDVEVPFIYGALVLVAFIAVLLIARPRYLPFSLKAIALFYFIRSIFVSLTHIRPFPVRAVFEESYFTTARLFKIFFTGDDLFFSGHVGLPFLLALIFWNSPRLRLLFLAASVLFAAVVLLGHLHYSIDVFAAYFITYAIFIIAYRFFRRDYERIAHA